MLSKFSVGDIHLFFYIFFWENKTRESSAEQRNQMKCRLLYSENNNNNNNNNKTMPIATDKRGYPHHIFLISPPKHMLWYSLEAPRWGASNEYPQHMFSRRNKKDISIFRKEKVLYLLIWMPSNIYLKKKKKKKQHFFSHLLIYLIGTYDHCACLFTCLSVCLSVCSALDKVCFGVFTQSKLLKKQFKFSL